MFTNNWDRVKLNTNTFEYILYGSWFKWIIVAQFGFESIVHADTKAKDMKEKMFNFLKSAWVHHSDSAPNSNKTKVKKKRKINWNNKIIKMKKQETDKSRLKVLL